MTTPARDTAPSETCRTCRHLCIPPNAIGRRIPKLGAAYPCVVPVPRPVLPLSADFYTMVWPPHRKAMRPCDGAGCPLHEPRDGAQ